MCHYLARSLITQAEHTPPLLFLFSFAKRNGLDCVHVMLVTSVPTGSRDRHPTFSAPGPRLRSRKSRERPPYYQNLLRLQGSYSEEKVWLRGGSFCFHSSIHGRSKGLRGLPVTQQPKLENGGGKWRVRWQSYQK